MMKKNRKSGSEEERKSGEKQKKTKTRDGGGLLLFFVLNFTHLNFDIVSDFVLRISDLFSQSVFVRIRPWLNFYSC